MYVRNFRELPVESSGVDGLSVRWAITATQGANNFAMRIFELDAGMASSLHQHDTEHEIFVLDGEGEVETPEGATPISEGSVIFIPSHEDHQFCNTGAKKLRFVDVVTFSIAYPQK